MNQNKYNFLEKALIFLAIIFKYLIGYGVNTYILYSILMVLTILTGVDIYNKKLNRKELGKIVIFGFIALFFVVFYADANFFISFILALLIYNKNNDGFVKIFFWCSVISYTLTIAMYYLGILESNNLIRNDSLNNVNIRYSLGFNHPNEVFLYFLPIALSGYLIYGEKRFYFITLIISSTALYKMSLCRTGYAIIYLLVILHIARKFLKKNIIKRMLPFCFIIFTIISIYIAITYGDSTSNAVSTFFSGRPFYWNKYIKNGTIISMFGKNRISGYNLDNFYIYILVELGMIGYFIYGYIYIASLKRLSLSVRYTVVLLVFLIYGLTEANVIIGSIQFVFAIQLMTLIAEKNKVKKELT